MTLNVNDNHEGKLSFITQKVPNRNLLGWIRLEVNSLARKCLFTLN